MKENRGKEPGAPLVKEPAKQSGSDMTHVSVKTNIENADSLNPQTGNDMMIWYMLAAVFFYEEGKPRRV